MNELDLVVDSYAWIEYFLGSEKGEKLRILMKNSKNNFLTVEPCLAELHGWTLRENINFNEIYRVLISNSSIVPVFAEDWIQAGRERHEQRKRMKDFGLIDSVILTKQKQIGCKLITGDKHFNGLKNIILMK